MHDLCRAIIFGLTEYSISQWNTWWAIDEPTREDLIKDLVTSDPACARIWSEASTILNGSKLVYEIIDRWYEDPITVAVAATREAALAWIKGRLELESSTYQERYLVRETGLVC